MKHLGEVGAEVWENGFGSLQHPDPILFHLPNQIHSYIRIKLMNCLKICSLMYLMIMSDMHNFFMVFRIQNIFFLPKICFLSWNFFVVHCNAILILHFQLRLVFTIIKTECIKLHLTEQSQFYKRIKNIYYIHCYFQDPYQKFVKNFLRNVCISLWK